MYHNYGHDCSEYLSDTTSNKDNNVWKNIELMVQTMFGEEKPGGMGSGKCKDVKRK